VSGDPCIKCACDTVGGKAIWPRLLYDKVCPSLASGEPGVRPLPEEAAPALRAGERGGRTGPLISEGPTHSTHIYIYNMKYILLSLVLLVSSLLSLVVFFLILSSSAIEKKDKTEKKHD
jgi:hypothetical protein